MLMAVCWKCGEIKQFSRVQELYLLKSVMIICPCGAENLVDDDMKQNIKQDWGLIK